MALVLQKNGIHSAQLEAGLTFFLRTVETPPRSAKQKTSAFVPFTRGCCGLFQPHS